MASHGAAVTVIRAPPSKELTNTAVSAVFYRPSALSAPKALIGAAAVFISNSAIACEAMGHLRRRPNVVSIGPRSEGAQASMWSGDLAYPGKLRRVGTTGPSGNACWWSYRRSSTVSRQIAVARATDPWATAPALTNMATDPSFWPPGACTCNRIAASLPMPDARDVAVTASGHTLDHSLYHPHDVIHGLPDTFTKDHRPRPTPVIPVVVSDPAVCPINSGRRNGPLGRIGQSRAVPRSPTSPRRPIITLY